MKLLSRMRFHGRGPLAVAALCFAAAATGQSYPQRPIMLVVPYAPGGPTDQHVRALAEEAGRILGQPIVMDNRPGASGTNGAAALTRAAPDGYTLAVLPASVYREPYGDYRAYALASHALEKDRVERLRKKGLLD